MDGTALPGDLVEDFGAIRGDLVDAGEVDRDHIRNRCYPVWAWECDQDSRKLREWIIERYGVDIPDRTLRYWAKHDGWRLRYEQDRIDIDPAEARPAIALRIQSAALGAALYLDEVNNGRITPTKERLTAAKLALDASGFAAIHITGSEAQTIRQQTRTLVDVRKLTNAELAARMRELRAGESLPPT